MADRLTQLQDSLDQLLSQMFYTLKYIDTRHPFAKIPGQSDQSPAAARNQAAQNATQDAEEPKPIERAGEEPEDPVKFDHELKMLAQDLVVKQAQIDYLVDSLPGLGNSEEKQEKRIEELEGELKEVEKERQEAAKEKERLLRLVESRILAARRP